MLIAESSRPLLSQLTQRTTVTYGKLVSNVSREERMQLLAEKMQPRKNGSAPDSYSERAQLLSAPGYSQYSWVA